MAKTKQMSNGSNFLNYSFITAAVTLLVMAAFGYYLIGFLPKQLNDQWQQQQIENQVDEIKLYIDLKYGQIDSLLEAFVNTESAQAALISQDEEAKALLINQILKLVPGVLSADLYKTGKIQANTSVTPPVNFAAVDMINRTLRGKPVGAEINGDYIYWSKAVRDSNDRIIGALTVFTDKGILSRIGDSLDANVGSILIDQTINNSTINVFNFGLNGVAERATSFDVDNPNWQVKYSPSELIIGSQIVTMMQLLIPLAGAVIVLLIIILMMGQVAYNALRTDMHQVAELIKFVEDGGSPLLPNFKISAFAALANRILRLQMPTAGNSNKNAIPDIVASTGKSDAPAIGVVMAEEIFRAYDIRGIVDRTLDKRIAYDIGRAYGSECRKHNQNEVVVGRDGRISSPEYTKYIVDGILSTGTNVIDVGEVPTPVVYFASKHLQKDSSLVITGSHNPANYNGFKLTLAGRTLAGSDIQVLKNRIDNEEFEIAKKKGTQVNQNLLDQYVKAVSETVKIDKKLRIVVDCGNGVTGVIAPKLFKSLGCKVLPLYAEVDGNFPNHHPDPSVEGNLETLRKTVVETNADLGIAFDGDGDRVGIVTNRGNIINADILLMLLARDILSREVNGSVVYDVKCSRRLNSLIRGFGGKPIIWKSGHSMIKNKMRESHAILGGELSGHFFINERWFGFDDGMYAAARILELLSQSEGDAEFMFSAFPHDESTPEIHIPVNESRKFEIIQAVANQASSLEGDIIDIDGIRVDFADGWGLIRASNTTPALSLRFEGDTEMAVQNIQQKFKALLLRIDPHLQIPF